VRGLVWFGNGLRTVAADGPLPNGVQRRQESARMIADRLLVPRGELTMVHERIVTDPKIMFGKPVIKGTRVTVELILRKIAEGMTDEQILAHHPHLSVDDIRAAAAFAADHLANEEIVLASGSNW